MEFDINKQVTPVVLEYLEPGWHDQTMQCLIASGFDPENILQVGREGVGSMSKAFNSVFEGMYGFDVITTEYVWFVSNITFDKHVPAFMAAALDEYNNVAAIHPKFASDHPHIRNAKGRDYVPFVEWTAPMIRMDALREIGLLDEKLPYWGQDIDWSHRAKVKGFELMVDGHSTVQHTYLRHTQNPAPITQIRGALRNVYNQSTENRLIEKWGKEWRKLLCPSNSCG
jgi:GT2 family glycosyltransferase